MTDDKIAAMAAAWSARSEGIAMLISAWFDAAIRDGADSTLARVTQSNIVTAWRWREETRVERDRAERAEADLAAVRDAVGAAQAGAEFWRERALEAERVFEAVDAERDEWRSRAERAEAERDAALKEAEFQRVRSDAMREMLAEIGLVAGQDDDEPTPLDAVRRLAAACASAEERESKLRAAIDRGSDDPSSLDAVIERLLTCAHGPCLEGWAADATACGRDDLLSAVGGIAALRERAEKAESERDATIARASDAEKMLRAEERAHTEMQIEAENLHQERLRLFALLEQFASDLVPIGHGLLAAELRNRLAKFDEAVAAVKYVADLDTATVRALFADNEGSEGER